MPDSPAARIPCLVGAAVAVIVLGLGTRRLPGVAGDAAGGVLYAVLVYLLLALGAAVLGRNRKPGRAVPDAAAPDAAVPDAAVPDRVRPHPVRTGTAAFTLCALVELFQLTAWPARFAGAWAPLALVFGTTFNAWDLVAYAGGAAAAAAGDALLLKAALRGGTLSRAAR